MKIYTDVYTWSVIDEIKNGADVFMVDRLVPLVHSANEMEAGALIHCIHTEERGRYTFYKIEEVTCDA